MIMYSHSGSIRTIESVKNADIIRVGLVCTSLDTLKEKSPMLSYNDSEIGLLLGIGK